EHKPPRALDGSAPRQEINDRPERQALAAARFADQSHCLPRTDREGNTGDGRGGVLAFADADAQLFHLQQRFAHARKRSWKLSPISERPSATIAMATPGNTVSHQ